MRSIPASSASVWKPSMSSNCLHVYEKERYFITKITLKWSLWSSHCVSLLEFSLDVSAFLGSSPKRYDAQYEIQWKSVCPSVCLSVSPLVRPPMLLALNRTDGRTFAQVSHVFYRALSLWNLSPAYFKSAIALLMGRAKGTIDHLLPLGDWFICSSLCADCPSFSFSFVPISSHFYQMIASCGYGRFTSWK